MKKILPFIIISLIALGANAQLISRFTWETSPTAAVAGANALSISTYATITTGGVNGSKGLSPGAGSNDINLVIDGASFNVPALDVAVDFRREESQASFFYRGSYFNFGMNGGNLVATFQLASGGTFITINSGNVFAIPDDHSFHNYHFNYDNNTGVAKIWADGILKYTYTGTAGLPLYWTGAGNVTIGREMDATGRNVAVLDNIIIQMQANALLPLTLVSFSAEIKNTKAVLGWKTTQELNVNNFAVERSSDGISFTAIASVAATGSYNGINTYSFTDSSFTAGIAYYRLKMVNSNGTYAYSSVKSVTAGSALSASVSVFPNPTADYVTIKINNAKAGQYYYTVNSIDGRAIGASTLQFNNGVNQVRIDLTKTAAKGIIIIRVSDAQNTMSETFTVIKK